jgi:hypothetical protein
MARSVPFGLVIASMIGIARPMAVLVATGASNVPIDRLGIARFGAR